MGTQPALSGFLHSRCTSVQNKASSSGCCICSWPNNRRNLTIQLSFSLQDELRRQRGAAAFHRKFAAELSLLLEDARGALSELHLTVSSLLASRTQRNGGTTAAGFTTSAQHGGGTTAAGYAGMGASIGDNSIGSAETALARAAACHGLLSLGRRRQPCGVQTAHCELWSLAAGPWGRNEVRKEVHAVMTGRAAPDVSLRALAAGEHSARLGIGGGGGGGGVKGNGDTACSPDGGRHPAAAAAGGVAAADFTLRKAPPAAATARAVQELYAAKAAADVAARTACKRPLPLCVRLRKCV